MGRFPGQHSFHPEMPDPGPQNQGREGQQHHHLFAPGQKEHPVRIIRPRDDASACDILSTIFLSGFNIASPTIPSPRRHQGSARRGLFGEPLPVVGEGGQTDRF